MGGIRERLTSLSREELIEYRKMKRAFRRGMHLTSFAEEEILNAGLRHFIESVEHEADLTRKHGSSAEVTLSFLVGMAVGAIKIPHRMLVPTAYIEVGLTQDGRPIRKE